MMKTSNDELRKKGGVKELIYYQTQHSNDFFKEQDSANVKYIFKWPIGDFKHKLLYNDENVINIIKNNNLK